MIPSKMTERKTSFGSMEILSEQPLVERMTFNAEGKSHSHEVSEFCYVLAGSGKIVGANKENVAEGDFCSIPPKTLHHMIPEKTPFKVLIFYSEKK